MQKYATVGENLRSSRSAAFANTDMNETLCAIDHLLNRECGRLQRRVVVLGKGAWYGRNRVWAPFGFAKWVDCAP